MIVSSQETDKLLWLRKPTDTKIKYPFYVLESRIAPGYVINIKKDSPDADDYKIHIKAADGNADERFDANTFTIPHVDCVE